MKSRQTCFCLLSICLLWVPISAFAAPPPTKSELEDRVVQLETLVAALQSELAAQSALLEGVSRIDDEITGYDTLLFEGMNVQIVNGELDTETTNGVGNLIIGYNESRAYPPFPGCPVGIFCDRRSGSHNLVIGKSNNYSAYGGTVIGIVNETSAAYASVSGGQQHLASGRGSSVSGGFGHLASGDYSSVSGGNQGIASGDAASISGGYLNVASGNVSSVSGGESNEAADYNSSVSGGQSRTALGQYDWVAGSLFEDD